MSKVSVILSAPVEKKHSVRYDAANGDENPAMTSAYISKDALAQLGNPPKIKVTIEAV